MFLKSLHILGNGLDCIWFSAFYWFTYMYAHMFLTFSKDFSFSQSFFLLKTLYRVHNQM